VTRDEILAANPLPDYLRNRGFNLYPAGSNFVTNACPVALHRKFHRCVTIDTAKNLFHCNDHDSGGTVIDWVMHEKKISAADALRELGGGRDGQESGGNIVCAYDYVGTNGKLLFQICRTDPKADFPARQPDGRGGWIWNVKGVKRVLYHLPEVIAAQTVVITEGEKDADRLTSLGFVATCNPFGAGKWQDQYSKRLRDKDVVIFGDADEPGRAHVEKVFRSLLLEAKSIKRVQLPDGFHDVSDFIESFSSSDEAKAAIEKLIEEAQEREKSEAKPEEAAVAEQPRVAKVDPPQTPTTIAQWRETIAKNFPALTRPAEICGSVMTQMLLNDAANPFALVLLDVPSSGKTITENFFDVPQLSYTTDHFTPASLVSNASNVRREDLGKVDMLPRIRYKTLIVRDLAPIFGAKEDALLEMVGRLTRALDGEGLETDSGVHGQRGYKGDYLFMMLAGSTPLSPRVYKVLGTLGSRLFFLQLHSEAKSHRQLISQNRGKDRKLKENECRKITENFLHTLWSQNPNGIDWNKASDPEDCLLVIARCAELLASLRGTMQIWRSDDDDGIGHSIPVIEQPDRINCLLYNLARGHALFCGRRQITQEDLWPVLEVTFDSAQTSRSKLFRHLIEKDGKLETPDVERLLRCTAPTARREMEALSVLGVVDKLEITGHATVITLADRFEWFTSQECSELRGKPRQRHMPGEQFYEEEIPAPTEVAEKGDIFVPTEGGKEKLRL
jgi:5S rRNA maturation endonuclease (ribonuclease M5)